MSNHGKVDGALNRLRKRKRPASKRVGIVMDSRYQQQLDDARLKLSRLENQARLRGNKADPDLAAEIDDARDELEAAQNLALGETEWFVARAMSPRQFDKLLSQHPATKEQKVEAKKNGVVAQFNFDTFPAALVARCVSLAVPLDKPNDDGQDEELVSLTAEFITEMLEGADEDGEGEAQWNAGEFGALFDAAFQVNQQRPGQVAQLGNA